MGHSQFFTRKLAGMALCASLLAACASVPRDPDPTPLNPTAIVEIQTVGSALANAPAFDNTSTTWSRANMQRTEFRNTIAGADGEPVARIERLDRKVAWTLDAKNKRFVECPLRGCGASGKKNTDRKSASDEKPRETECRLRAGNTTVSVEPTGRKRSVNGFETEQYDLKWIVTFRDNAARKSTSTVSIDAWIAAATPEWNSAATIEKNYQRARDKLLGVDSEERPVLLPADAMRMISSYLAPNVSPTDRATFLAGAKKLDKVRGVPVLTTVKWSFSGEACAANDSSNGAGEAPLFTLTSETRAHRVEPRHDSLFSPPKDYKIAR
jgi:hypothetical protein